MTPSMRNALTWRWIARADEAQDDRAEQARGERRVVLRPVLPRGEGSPACGAGLPVEHEPRPAVEMALHERLAGLESGVLGQEVVADETVGPEVGDPDLELKVER